MGFVLLSSVWENICTLSFETVALRDGCGVGVSASRWPVVCWPGDHSIPRLILTGNLCCIFCTPLSALGFLNKAEKCQIVFLWKQYVTPSHLEFLLKNSVWVQYTTRAVVCNQRTLHIPSPLLWHISAVVTALWRLPRGKRGLVFTAPYKVDPLRLNVWWGKGGD